MDQPTDEGDRNEESDDDLSFQSGSEDDGQYYSPGADQEHEIHHRIQNVLMIDTGGGSLSTSFRPHHHHRHHHHRYPDDENPSGGGGDSNSDTFYTPTGGDASIPSFTTAGAPSDETSFLGSSTVDTRSFLGEDEPSLEEGESSMEQARPSSAPASTVDIYRTASAETREDGEDEPSSSMQPETPRASNTARRLYIQQQDPKQRSNEVMSEVESLPDDEMIDTVHTSNLADRTALLALPETLFVGSLGRDEGESSVNASHGDGSGDTKEVPSPPDVSRVTDYPAEEVDDSVVRASNTENMEDVGKSPSTELVSTVRNSKGNVDLSTKEYLDTKDQNSGADSGHPEDGVDVDNEDGSSSAELVDLELSNKQNIHSEAMAHEPHLIVNDVASVQDSLGVPSSEAFLGLFTNPSADSVHADGGNRSDGNDVLAVPRDSASTPTDSTADILQPSASGYASEEPTKTSAGIVAGSMTDGNGAVGSIDDFEHLLAEAEHDFLSMLGMDASTRSIPESAVVETHSEKEKGRIEATVILSLDSSDCHQPSNLVPQSSALSGPKRDDLKEVAVDLGTSLSASSWNLDASETTADEDNRDESHRSIKRAASMPTPENSSHAHQECIERSETEESSGSSASIRAILQKELEELGRTPNTDLNSPDPKPMLVSRADSGTIILDSNYQDTPTVDGPSSVAEAENRNDRSFSNIIQLTTDVPETPKSPRQAVEYAPKSCEAARSRQITAPPGSPLETAVTISPVDELLPQTTPSVSSPEDQEREETTTSQFQRKEEPQYSKVDTVLACKSPDQHNCLACPPERQTTLLSSQAERLAEAAESKLDREAKCGNTALAQFAQKPQALVPDAPDTEKLETSDSSKRQEGERHPNMELKDKNRTDEETQPGVSLSKGHSVDETFASEKTPRHSVDPEEPKTESTGGHTKTPLSTENAEKAEEMDLSQRISPAGTENNTDLEIVGEKETDRSSQLSTTLKSPPTDDLLGAKTATLEKSQNGEEPLNAFGKADNLERKDGACIQSGSVPEIQSTSQTTGDERIQPFGELKSLEVDERPNNVSVGPDRQKQPEAGWIKGGKVSVGSLGNLGDVEPQREIDNDEKTQPTESLSKGPSIHDMLASEKTSEIRAGPEEKSVAGKAGNHKGHSQTTPVDIENDIEKAKEVDVTGVPPTGLQSNADNVLVYPNETEEEQPVMTLKSPLRKMTEKLEKSTNHRKLEDGDDVSNASGETENVEGLGKLDTQSDHKAEILTTRNEGHQHTEKPRFDVRELDVAGDISPKSADAESAEDIEFDSVKTSERTRDVGPKTAIGIPSESFPETVQGKSETTGQGENSGKIIGATEVKREQNQSTCDRIEPQGGMDGMEKRSLASAASAEDDTAGKQKSRIDSKPPLFPRKAKELYENPDSFVEFLSKKLVAQVLSKERTPEGNRDISPQVKRSAFDPEQSVFANFAGDWESLELSPPGSPPEPSFEQSDDDGSSSEGSQESNSNLVVRFVHPEAATWDLVSEPISAAASFGLDESTTRHPDYVMMPDDARTPSALDTMIPPSIARADSLPSDTGVLSRQRSQKISFGDASLSSSQQKRLEPSAGLLSVSHRTSRKRPLSARASKKKNRVKWARRSRFPGLALARSEELRTVNSHDADDPDETVSLGAKLLRDEIFRNLPGNQVSCEGNLLKSVSSPDLGSAQVAAALRLERDEEAAAKTDIFRVKRPSLIRQSKSFEMPRVEFSTLSVTSPEHQVTDDSSQKRSPERSTANEANLLLLGRLGCDLSSDQEESMLHEELLTFTTLEPIDFPFQFCIQDDSIRYCGSLCWQQLLSCWRHDQLVKSLTKDPITQPLTQEELDIYKENDIESSHGHVKNEPIDFLDLNGTRLFPDGSIRNALTGGNMRSEAMALSLLRSLSSRSPNEEEGPLRHVMLSSDKISVEEMLLAAESNLGVFTALIKSLVGFACYELLGEMSRVIDFHVGTKTSEATLKKAKRKYDGDVLQVKDIIRGSIIFPTVQSLLCGLVFLAEICSNGGGWEVGDRRVKLEVVRVKNLFASSSLMGGFDRSPLPTGYRHVLLNVRLEGGVLAEIQCHLSRMYDILGKTGHILHQDLNNLTEACGGKFESSFTIYGKLLKDIIGHRTYFRSSPFPHVKDPLNAVSREMGKEKNPSCGNAMSIALPDASREQVLKEETSEPVVDGPKPVVTLGSAPPKNPDEISATILTQNNVTTPPRLEENDKVISPPLHGIGERATLITKEPVSSQKSTQHDFEKKLSELETPIAGRSLRNPDPAEESHIIKPISWAILSPVTRHDGLSSVTKSKMLKDLQSTDEAPSPESIMLAILECATSAVSGSPRDLASFFCLHMLLISFLRDANVSLLKSKDGPIKEAKLVEYSRRCLLRCFVLCCQATSLGMTGWLEYGENDPIVRLEEGPANLLNLIADSFAQELKWREAQSVLQSLYLMYERELPSYHPLIIESIFNLASVASINGNASFAAKLIGKATDAVSRHFVELETSLLSFIQSYSSSDPSNMPSFRAEGLGSALVALGWYVSNLHEIVGTAVSVHRYTSGVIFIQQSLVADGFAVLANCKATARAKLGSRSLSETISGRYYWKLALTYYHKAFKGVSATKGFEDHRVCAAAFGMARCLRELGEHQKALELLSTVVAALETTPVSPVAPKAALQPFSLQHFGGEKKRDPFLSQVLYLQSQDQGGEPQIHHHVTVALCLWQMSVLSVDGSRDERGRTRAFGLLHAASVSMQLALRELSDTDGMIQTTCIDILEKIENEAKKISKPLRRLQ